MAKIALFVCILLGVFSFAPASNFDATSIQNVTVTQIPESVLNEIFCDVAECWPASVCELWESYRSGTLSVKQASKDTYEVRSAKDGNSLTLVLLDDAA